MSSYLIWLVGLGILGATGFLAACLVAFGHSAG